MGFFNKDHKSQKAWGQSTLSYKREQMLPRLLYLEKVSTVREGERKISHD